MAKKKKSPPIFPLYSINYFIKLVTLQHKKVNSKKKKKSHLTNCFHSLKKIKSKYTFLKSIAESNFFVYLYIWKSNLWSAFQNIFPEWAYYTRIAFNLSRIKFMDISSIIWSCCSLILLCWQNIQVQKNHILRDQNSWKFFNTTRLHLKKNEKSIYKWSKST